LETDIQRTVDELLAENEQLRHQLIEYKRVNDLWAEAEAEWKRNKRLFRIMTENVEDLIAIIDRQGHRIWNNPAYSKVLGYTPEELQGSYSMVEIHPDDQATVMNAFYMTLQQGVGQRIEYRMQHKSGHWITLESQSAPVLDATGQVECIVLVARDITHRRQAEQELIKAKNLQSAATLATGVANEFNDIITAILGHVAVAKKLNGTGYNALATRLNEIEQNVQRARDVTERLRSFALGDEGPRKELDLREVISDSANRSVRNTLARTQLHLNKALWKVKAEPTALGQVFFNVIQNAALSMRNGGVVQIIGENFVARVGETRNRAALPPGRYSQILVRDQGCGMTEKTLMRAFEPYFTTREGAKGLGLTTALATIQNLGGALVLESTLGVGTEATLYLPAVDDEKVSRSVATTETQWIAASSKPRVLLMDDEQMILDLVAKMLEHLGFEVKTAKDGAQAIAAYTKGRSAGFLYDIVIMDLVVPNGVGGVDAVHTLRKINPNIKVIASTGHLDHPAVQNPEKYGFIAVLEKPYKLDKLSQVLDAVNSARTPG
jgi:PAS domain S-box-containing protein